MFPRRSAAGEQIEREFIIDNLLVQIHFIIVMIRWTGLAPWEFRFSFPGSLTSTFIWRANNLWGGEEARAFSQLLRVLRRLFGVWGMRIICVWGLGFGDEG